MGADEIALPARLVKTPQGDELRFSDGQVLRLAQPLSCSNGQEMMIAVVMKNHYQVEKQALAKQLLLEIVK
jgi:hypothetical protein